MAHPNPPMSVRQYMEMLQESDIRYEYWDGEAVAVAGASLRHNLITFNLAGLLWGQLRGKECMAASSDQLVKEESQDRYLFPDLVVHCRGGRIEKTFVDVVLDPVVVIEVLSPSTATADRTRKFESYSKIASLRHLLLVSQDMRIVEHFYRDSIAAGWRVKHLFEHDHELVLDHVGCRLKVAEIYEGVDEIV